MTQPKEGLLIRAVEIRDEVREGANSATRVGDFLIDLVGALPDEDAGASYTGQAVEVATLAGRTLSLKLGNGQTLLNVPLDEPAPNIAGIEVFSATSPTGYKKAAGTVPASLVRHVLDTRTRFFTALKDLNYVGGVPIPAPTGLANDTNWREAAPPATSYVAYQEISYTALYNLWQDGKMVPRRTYGIYDSPAGGGLMLFAEFDEADSTLAFGVRKQNTDEIWRYNVSTDTLSLFTFEPVTVSVFDVAEAKRTSVVAANSVAVLEASNVWWGKEFYDEVSTPGTTRHYRCGQVVLANGSTVWKWFRTTLS